MKELKSFWNEEHALSAKSTELFNTLVASSGPSTTLHGELLRASTKISYDWYNNGWGCNNWSGAVQFIKKWFSALPAQPTQEILDSLKKNLAVVDLYSHGEPCGISDRRADEVLIAIHEIIVQALIDNPTLISSTQNMYDLQEESYQETDFSESEY